MSNPLLAGLGEKKKEVKPKPRPKPKSKSIKPKVPTVSNTTKKIKELEKQIQVLSQMIMEIKVIQTKNKKDNFKDINEFINWIIGLDIKKYPIQAQLINQVKKYKKKHIIKNVFELYKEFKGE